MLGMLAPSVSDAAASSVSTSSCVLHMSSSLIIHFQRTLLNLIIESIFIGWLLHTQTIALILASRQRPMLQSKSRKEVP